MKPPTEQPWWADATEQPPYMEELQQAFVDADLCAWDARGRPHPQPFAMVALHFFRNLPSPHNTQDDL